MAFSLHPAAPRALRPRGLLRLGEQIAYRGVPLLFLLVVDENEQLLAGVNAELGVDVAHVVVERARGDAERVLNLRGGLAGDEQPQHVGLARGEAELLGGEVRHKFALRHGALI